MKKFFFIPASFLLLVSCHFFQPEAKPEAIARVNDMYLYKDDIKDLVPRGTSKEDSAVIVRNYIDGWASQKLLIDAAEINLSEDKQAELDKLVREYKMDLFSKAYIEEIVKRTVDTVISTAELSQYYAENKENFKTNGTLVRLRFIHLKQDNPKFEIIKSKFFDFKKSDQKFWDTYVLQSLNYALNDTIWVDMNQVYSKLPFINPENRDNFIVPGKTISYPDSSDVYLVKITNVLERNQTSPFEYVKPTLKEVLLNKRKLELIKKFEKEITDDAIKNKKYEIYK